MGSSRRDLELRVDLTTGCNLRCVMCTLSLLPRSHRFECLSLEQIHRLARAFFHRARAVSWSWATEPLLSPDLVEAVAIAQSAGVPDISMITNAVLLRPSRSQALVEAGLNRLVVSIDGGSPETFKAIRDGASLEKVIENLLAFSEAAARVSTRPSVEVNTVVMRRNICELAAIVEIAGRIGADQHNLIRASDYGLRGMQDQSLEGLPPEHIESSLAEAVRSARQIGVRLMISPLLRSSSGARKRHRAAWLLHQFVRKSNRQGLGAALRLAWFQARHGRNRCASPYFNLQVRGNGDIVPCCEWSYDAPLAHVDDDLDGFLEGEARSGLQGSMEGRAPVRNSCRQCPVFSLPSVDTSPGASPGCRPPG